MSLTADIEEFIRLHRPHGQLVGDAAEPTLIGYRVAIECRCGVTFLRYVTAVRRWWTWLRWRVETERNASAEDDAVALLVS